MPYGLTSYQLDQITNLLNQYSEIQKTIIFGSRALGIQKNGSDVDLAIVGNIDFRLLSNIKYRLEEELPLPFFFDVIDYKKIKNIELKDHIDQFGKILYSRSKEEVKS